MAFDRRDEECVWGGWLIAFGARPSWHRLYTWFHMRTFFQQICALEPITRLGLSCGLPALMRLARHFHFIASTASIIASEDPTVAVPVPSGGNE